MLGLERHEVAIGARAFQEVFREPAASLIGSAVEAGTLRVESIDLDDPEEAISLGRFDALPAFQDRGDAEVLAIAECRGHLVGSDDEAILRAAHRASRIPGFATSLDLVVWAVRENRLVLEDAERLIDRLDIGPRIRERLTRMGRNLAELI